MFKHLSESINETIRNVADFPKPGIQFKDITPILKEARLCAKITEALAMQIDQLNVDAIAAIESRGFLFGMSVAMHLNLPFVPIRKAGKLPYTTFQQEYALEYGNAAIEMHVDAFKPGQKVLIHDDLLATGGTVQATKKLIEQTGATVAGYAFIVSLDALGGKKLLESTQLPVISLMDYQ